MAESHPFSIQLDENDYGKRVDIHVAFHIHECSRSFAADLVRKGKILVNGNIVKPAYKLKAGDEITGEIPAPEPVDLTPEPVQFATLYEDEDVIVVDKPPGIVVHPAPGHNTGTLVHGLLYRCPDIDGDPLRPGIVHRLDKDTSGVLIIAKNPFSHQCLSDQFKNRTIKKEYFALVDGVIQKDTETIDLPIGRHPTDRKKMSIRARISREAVSIWHVDERFQRATALRIHIKTGRTHQIRVHLSAIGYPIIGDDIYGLRKPVINAPRQMLHAWRINFFHPRKKKEMNFEAPIPSDIRQVVDLLRTESD